MNFGLESGVNSGHVFCVDSGMESGVDSEALCQNSMIAIQGAWCGFWDRFWAGF